MIDFNKGMELPNRFAGSEKKKTIEVEGIRYLVKFPDPVRQNSSDVSYINNVYSEYIGSQIFDSIGLPVQKTRLGKYTTTDGQEKVVCGCEDFNSKYYQLVEFSNISISNIDMEGVDTNDIYAIEKNIRMNMSIVDTEKAISRFWDIFIVDALIGNTDRHSANWGFMEDMATHTLSLAPVYDCGSSLLPIRSDDKISKLLLSEVSLKNQVYNIYSCLRSQGKRIHYGEFIGKMENEKCNQALCRIFPQTDVKALSKIVESIPNMSLERRTFYNKVLEFRYEKILRPVFEKLIKIEREKNLKEEKEWYPRL